MWICPECDRPNSQEVEVPELNFSADKMSEMGTDDLIEIACDHCDTIFTGHVWVYSDSTEFEIREPKEFSISGDMPMYSPPEDEYEPPEDPYSIAKEALGQLAKMIGTVDGMYDDQFTNRLVFAGAVSIMEAYLGDTLINAVIHDGTVRSKLVQNNSKLGAIKTSASELAADPKTIDKKLVKELRNILYHNLDIVVTLFKDAFGFDLIPDPNDRNILFNAMPRRHDCVHRNGWSKDGKQHDDFTKEYVRRVITAINSMTDNFEDERSKNLPF